MLPGYSTFAWTQESALTWGSASRREAPTLHPLPQGNLNATSAFLRNILNENNIWVGKISSARALSWIWTIFMEPSAIPQE